MRTLLFAMAVVAAIGTATAAHADSAKPADPNGYGGVVSFGAREDHDLYPGPGNVIGDVRSAVASGGDGTGLSEFVKSVKGFTGSTPKPPGHE